MKFPSTSGICTIRGDQLAAQECYSVAMKGKSQPEQQEIVIDEGVKSLMLEVTHGTKDPREGDNEVAQ